MCVLSRGMSVVTYDLESVVDDADSHELLAVVAAVHHQGVGQALDDRAVSLAETLDRVATGRVGDIDGVAEGDVVTVRKIVSTSMSSNSQVRVLAEPPKTTQSSREKART